MSESVLLTDDQPVDPDDELLVAYLDDELDDAMRKSVEKRLVAETEFQRRLQSLQTGWEWLDELPNESTNEKLVESTIELVVEDIIPRKSAEPSWFRVHWRKIAFIGLLAAAFSGGVIGTRIEGQMALQRDLEELAIAENQEAYKLGDDFSFYRELAYNERWQNMIETMEKVGQREMAASSVVASIPLQQRDDVLNSLPTETREKLLGRWEAYNGFSETTKQKMRQIAKKVNEAEDGDKLLRTMKAASVWLEDLGEELRDRLQSDDEQVRKKALNDAIDITLGKLARDSGRLISDETSDQIYLWLQVLFEQRLEADENLKAMITRGENAVEQAGRDPAWVSYGFIWSMVDDRDSRGRGNGFGGGMRLGPGFGGPGFAGPGLSAIARQPAQNNDSPDDENRREPPRRPTPPRIPPVTDEEYDELKKLLSDEARSDLLALTSLSTELASDDIYPVNATLRTWAREALRRNSPILDLEQTPLDRYRARDDQDRDELDLLPPDEILNEIYLRPGRRNWPRGGPR